MKQIIKTIVEYFKISFEIQDTRFRALEVDAYWGVNMYYYLNTYRSYCFSNRFHPWTDEENDWLKKTKKSAENICYIL